MQQIEKILSFLDSEKISCEYMADDRIIHALYNDGETEVHCFFLCGFPDKVISYSICSKPIDIAKREEVETNLRKINEEIQTGYFYFDMDNHRIAYYNDFQANAHTLPLPHQQTRTTESNNHHLEKFCRWSYEVFQLYDKALYIREKD